MSDYRMTLRCEHCGYEVSLNDSLWPDVHEEHFSADAMREHINSEHPGSSDAWLEVFRG